MRFVTKKELVQLAVGKRYDEIEEIPFENIGQGYGFKSSEAYHAGSDYVCYIPEYCVNEETMELDLDSCYTKADFLELTGSEAAAQDLLILLIGSIPLLYGTNGVIHTMRRTKTNEN